MNTFDGVTATRTVFEGAPAVLLSGDADTLAEFVDELPPDLDTDHSEEPNRPRICTVWPAWTTTTFDGLLASLRRASDASGIDLTISAASTVRDTIPPEVTP